MNVPESFARRLQEELPEETTGLLAAITASKAVTSIRLNTAKTTHLPFVTGDTVPWEKNAFYLPERPVFTLDPLFHAGAYYVQEASSMLLGQVVKQLAGIQTILDLCAAPGGKSTQLISCLPTDGVLVANEILPNRAAVLAENLTKWGDKRVIVTNNRPADFLKTTVRYDLVVCDAPCSGEGLFRRDPDAMKEWSASSPQKCAVRQRGILSSAMELVKPGGYLIYSTCTYAVVENEEVVHSLIAAGFTPQAVKVPEDHGFMDSFHLGKTGHAACMFRAMPHKVAGEGFFLAVLRKPTAVINTVMSAKKVTIELIDPNIPFFNADILCKQLTVRYKGNIYAWTAPVKNAMEQLSSKLNILKAGIRLGKWQGSVFIPDHDAALSAEKLTDTEIIELVLEEARWYLSKLPFNYRAADNGWKVVSYHGLALGWVQLLADSSYNHYPNAWKIRMSLPA